MRTPEEMLVMHKLLELGWSRQRIAAELGISRKTEHMDWLRERFERHHGIAEVVRQELVNQRGGVD